MSGKPTHFEMGVPDVARAHAFYGGLFGWTFEATPNGMRVETGGVGGGIHADEPGIRMFFTVPDIDEAARRIVELGGEVDAASSEGPRGRFLHECRDDQGVTFGLHQPLG